MRYVPAVIFAALLMMPATAPAQQKGSIELRSVSEVEVIEQNAQGKKEVMRIEAAKAKIVPGDTVIFTVFYANTDTKPAARVVVTNPVPEHMSYKNKSAEGVGATIDFSVDGGKSYAASDKLFITAAGKKRSAIASDYTHIRWILAKPLAPGGKGSVSFRATLK